MTWIEFLKIVVMITAYLSLALLIVARITPSHQTKMIHLCCGWSSAVTAIICAVIMIKVNYLVIFGTVIYSWISHIEFTCAKRPVSDSVGEI